MMAGALLRAMRPKQWLKNVLVATGPLAAGTLLQPDVVVRVAIAFIVFCLAASAIYLFNDLVDIDDDREHPTKRLRPLAAGTLSRPVAIGAMVALVGASIALPLAVGLPELALFVGGYTVLQVAYCLWLKSIVVVELVIVASGFVIRAVAGAVIDDVELSQWFLLVMSFGSLFMVAGKRYAERVSVADVDLERRRRLRGYSVTYLRFVWSLAAGIAMTSYALWAFELGASAAFPWATISIVPFVIAVLRYAVSVDAAKAGAPEDTVLGDPQLAGLALLWLASFIMVIVFG